MAGALQVPEAEGRQWVSSCSEAQGDHVCSERESQEWPQGAEWCY